MQKYKRGLGSEVCERFISEKGEGERGMRVRMRKREIVKGFGRRTVM